MQSEKQIAAAQGVLGRGGVYVGAELVRTALEAALSAAEPIGVRCTGCGSSWDDERLAEERAKRPALLSCCPERKVIPVYAAPPAPSVGVRADAIVDRLFDDLRDRRFLKWIFDARGSDCYIGDMGGQKITGLDLDVQHEIKSQWSNIIDSALSAQVQDVAENGLTLSALQSAHVKRQEEWCPDVKPDLSFRGNELGGECGEAQNVIKKLERERHGWRGSRDTVEHLAEELADVIHCSVLVAITAGVDLQQAVIAKFNDTSMKNGLSVMLHAAPAKQEGGESQPVHNQSVENGESGDE